MPHYSLLPNTGKVLLKIDGKDWRGDQQGSNKLPAARQLLKIDGKTKDGQYFHFGLERALAGTSPGIIHRDADLIQYAELFYDDPRLIPSAIRKRVRLYSLKKNSNSLYVVKLRFLIYVTMKYLEVTDT